MWKATKKKSVCKTKVKITEHESSAILKASLIKTGKKCVSTFVYVMIDLCSLLHIGYISEIKRNKYFVRKQYAVHYFLEILQYAVQKLTIGRTPVLFFFHRYLC